MERDIDLNFLLIMLIFEIAPQKQKMNATVNAI